MNSSLIHLPSQPFTLPPELSAPYTGDRYISREPFLMNDLVDDTKVATELRNAAIGDKQVFMGIAGFRALDLLSVAGCNKGKTYSQALLFDNNEQQVRAMETVLQLIEECPNAGQFREEFIRNYLPWVEQVPHPRKADEIKRILSDPNDPAHAEVRESENYFGVAGRGHIPESREAVKEYFRSTIENPNSWLQPENYARIRTLVQKQRLAMARLNLTDNKRMDLLQQDWQDKEYRLGHCYVSTVLGVSASGRTTDYHGMPRAPQSEGNSDVQKMRKNLFGLTNENSRFLASDVGMGDFGEREKLSGFKLVSTDRQGLLEACKKMENRAANSHCITDIFAVGKKSYHVIGTKAESSPYHQDFAGHFQNLRNKDYILVLAVEIKPRSFSNKEIGAITTTLEPLIQRYQLDEMVMAEEADNSPSTIILRIREDVMQTHPHAPQEILEALKTTLRATAKTVARE